MGSIELVTPLPISVAYHAGPAVAPDPDFDLRWAAWMARGRVHEQRLRQRFATWASILAIGAAIVYGFVK